MAEFIYQAKNKQGETESGHLRANNKYELAALLRSKGLTLVSAKGIGLEDKSGSQWKRYWQQINSKFGRVSIVEKMLFSRHLAIMLDSGLSLDEALIVLAKQGKSSKFKKTIFQIENNIKQGKAFSDCLADYPKIFDQLYVNMVKIGEATGNLSKVLKILAEQMRKDHELIRRVRGAMMYPAVIVIAMIGIGILMMIIVVPKLTSMFEELGIDLPLSTQLVIGVSNFLKESYLIGILIIISLIVGFKFLLRLDLVKEILSKIYIHLPIFGGLVRKINCARFSRTLSALTQSGVRIVRSLRIVSGTLKNQQYHQSLKQVADQIEKGEELSSVLKNYQNLYNPMIIQMIKVGEQTGSLAEILENLADFYEEDIDNTTQNMSALIEPLIMLLIGGAVGFFAISMLQPMYSMMSGI